MECGGFPIDWMFWSAIPAANWECLGEKGSGDDGRDDEGEAAFGDEGCAKVCHVFIDVVDFSLWTGKVHDLW